MEFYGIANQILEQLKDLYLITPNYRQIIEDNISIGFFYKSLQISDGIFYEKITIHPIKIAFGRIHPGII